MEKMVQVWWGKWKGCSWNERLRQRTWPCGLVQKKVRCLCLVD